LELKLIDANQLIENSWDISAVFDEGSSRALIYDPEPDINLVYLKEIVYKNPESIILYGAVYGAYLVVFILYIRRVRFSRNIHTFCCLIAYSINATNIEGATAGHVHLGKGGKNGPVVVTLFKYDSPTNQVTENGTITADRLEGPMTGKQISDLATAGANGTLYINIHTEQNPNGAIRGQGENPTTQ
jgi:hypothetical protein